MNIRGSSGAIALAGAIFALLVGCSRAPRGGSSIDQGAFEQVLSARRPADFKGAGEVTIAIRSERHHGYADVRYSAAPQFKATFYSPVGSTIGTVRATADSAFVVLDDTRLSFGLDDTMDSLPYAWGSALKFRQFIGILLGELPEAAQVLRNQPESIERQGRFSVARWKSDSVTIDARVDRRSEQLHSVVITYAEAWGRWTVEMRAFRNGLARGIVLKDNDRNYFSLLYDKVIIN